MTKISKSKLIDIIKECVNEGMNWTHGLTKKGINKIVHLDHIVGVTEDEDKEISNRDKKATYSFVIKRMPWVLNYGYKSEVDGSWVATFAHFFGKEMGYTKWAENLLQQIHEVLRHYKHWIQFPKEQLKGAAKTNPHWIKRFKHARETFLQHPTFEKDLTDLSEYVGELLKRSPTEPRNQANYPLFVSLYDSYDAYGGPEEGGWNYKHHTLVESITVNSYQEARKAAVKLIKVMYDLVEENPTIILEKREGSESTTHKPHYS